MPIFILPPCCWQVMVHVQCPIRTHYFLQSSASLFLGAQLNYQWRVEASVGDSLEQLWSHWLSKIYLIMVNEVGLEWVWLRWQVAIWCFVWWRRKFVAFIIYKYTIFDVGFQLHWWHQIRVDWQFHQLFNGEAHRNHHPLFQVITCLDYPGGERKESE